MFASYYFLLISERLNTFICKGRSSQDAMTNGGHRRNSEDCFKIEREHNKKNCQGKIALRELNFG